MVGRVGLNAPHGWMVGATAWQLKWAVEVEVGGHCVAVEPPVAAVGPLRGSSSLEFEWGGHFVAVPTDDVGARAGRVDYDRDGHATWERGHPARLWSAASDRRFGDKGQAVPAVYLQESIINPRN